MNELSLFSGAGGGLLGSKLLGWKTLGYVEYEEYCQKVLRQRIADGILDAAPIFGDIRKFISEGYADAYQGMVDVVSGGFPCQPFSVAGKGLAENDPRNMWTQTIEVIRRVRPKFAFLENVPGLLSHRYIERIFGDLAESGFDCRWDIIGASDVGANHRRKRLWILAYSQGGKGWRLRESGLQPDLRSGGKDVADPASIGRRQGGDFLERGSVLSDTNRNATETEQERKGRQRWVSSVGSILSNTNNSGLEECREERIASEQFAQNSRWPVEPGLGRVADGVAHRVDRLKAIGNGQVPICMAYAFSKLFEGIIE